LLLWVASHDPNKIIAIPTPVATPNGSSSTSTPIAAATAGLMYATTEARAAPATLIR